MARAPAASKNVRTFREVEMPMILIAPLTMPAAPAPEVARPAMNIRDEEVVAQTTDPPFRTCY